MVSQVINYVIEFYYLGGVIRLILKQKNINLEPNFNIKRSQTHRPDSGLFRSVNSEDSSCDFSRILANSAFTDHHEY
jgi:hypothetical protein